MRRSWSSPSAASSSGTRSRTYATSSTRSLIERPAGIPFHGFVVSPGHITAIRSPIARRFFESWRFSPSPNDSSRMIATVPQVIAAIVRNARLRASRDDWLKR